MFNNILQLSFWFDLRPSFFTPIFFWFFIILFIIILLFALFSTYLLKNRLKSGTSKIVWTKLLHLSYSTSTVGLILVFLKQQRASYLGMRVWLFLWLLICFIWLLFIIKYLIKEVPRIKRERQERREFEKYLP